MARRRDTRTSAAHVRDFLARSPAAVRCLELQRREDGLLARVRDLLAPAARLHCIQVQTAEGALTVTVDSTAWATRLRYQAPDLVKNLSGVGITQVKVRARPAASAASHRPVPQWARLRPAVVNHLLAAAEGTADAELAQLFRRLATRHSQLRPGDPDV